MQAPLLPGPRRGIVFRASETCRSCNGKGKKVPWYLFWKYYSWEADKPDCRECAGFGFYYVD